MGWLLGVLLICVSWRTVPGDEMNVDFVRDLAQPQYPALGQSATVDCDGGGATPEQVIWFRMLMPSGTLQVLGRSNKADRVTYSPGMNESVRISKRSGTAYTLRILRATPADRGVYTCVLKLGGKVSNDQRWRRGVLLLPGETPPQSLNPQQAPGSLPPSRCLCVSHKQRAGCGLLVLWPLVGLVCVLGLSLVCVLIYFSRLPKKCRHHFRKK